MFAIYRFLFVLSVLSCVCYQIIIWVARVWLKTGGVGVGRKGGGARQGAKISEIGAQILGNRCFFEENQSGFSRDVVGNQFSSFWHHVWTCREAAKITQKRAKTLQKCMFFNEFGCLPTLVPDWIPTGSMDRQEPTPAPIFPCQDPPLPLFSFSAHQPCTNTPPLLHQNGKSSLKPNGGSTNYIIYYTYMHIIYICKTILSII